MTISQDSKLFLQDIDDELSLKKLISKAEYLVIRVRELWIYRKNGCPRNHTMCWKWGRRGSLGGKISNGVGDAPKRQIDMTFH